jgi:hypothetical protein
MPPKSEVSRRSRVRRGPDRSREIRSAVFAEKMASFAAQLDRYEQAMLREVLERGGLAEKDLAAVKPGVIGSASVAAAATKLDASFFHGLLDW